MAEPMLAWTTAGCGEHLRQFDQPACGVGRPAGRLSIRADRVPADFHEDVVEHRGFGFCGGDQRLLPGDGALVGRPGAIRHKPDRNFYE